MARAALFQDFLDNGASFISTPFRGDLTDIRPIPTQSIGALGSVLSACESGTMHVRFRDSGITVALRNVLHLPDSRVRLFSESQLARHGIKTANDYSGLVKSADSHLLTGNWSKHLYQDGPDGQISLARTKATRDVFPLQLDVLEGPLG